MRSVNGRPAQREGDSCFLIRRWEFGDDYTIVTAVHVNDLIRRRFSLDNPTLTNNHYINSLPSDDAIKIKWNQANGSLIDAFRAYSTVTSVADQTQNDISAYVTVQALTSLAPIIVRDVPWLNLLDVFHDLADFSTDSGTYLTAEIVCLSESTLQLQTFVGQRGSDRRFSTGNGLVFSNVRGNLENVLFTIDAIEEKTFAMSIGASPYGEFRYAGTSKDAARLAESPFNRIETVVDASDAPNDSGLTDWAQSGVQAGRPIVTASADLIETDQCIRGIH